MEHAQSRSAEPDGRPRPHGRRRAAVAVVIFGVLLLISVLGLLRVPSTTVALDIGAREVGFVSTAQQPLTDRFPISYLGSLGSTGVVDLPRSRTHPPATYPATSVVLWTDNENGQVGHAILRELVIPDSGRIRLRHATPESPYRLTIDGPIGELALDVKGAVHLTVPGALDELLHFDRAGTVTFSPAADTTVLEFTLGGPLPVRFFPQLYAAALDLTRLDVFRLDTLSVDRKSSSIAGGSIRFESLRGEEAAIHSGQWLEFDQSEGVIHQLDLTDDLINLKFFGEVEGMKVGARQVRRNLMPTVLQWLRARQTLGLVWGAVFALIALVEFAAKIWRSDEQTAIG